MRKTTWIVTGIVTVCVSLGYPLAAFGAEGFALRVDDVSGLDEPWPLVAGLPFAEGELRDAGAIRIVSGGEDVPAQIDVAATWRDGSVRWALAAFAGSPQAEYRVEYGEGVSRSTPEAPLRVDRAAGGGLAVDTGAAVYEFLPGRLLPEHARMGGTEILAGSGGGAYLVDNRGREGRVAGPQAEIESEILKEGPMRAVVRREGWYVTADGERLARARAWFYFAAESPAVRMTHSLVLTEDTNEVWARDYGLEFRTPEAPERATFALGAPGEEELFAVDPEGGEVFMLQETYPHFLDRGSRAEVSRVGGGGRDSLSTADAAGDWADAGYGGFGLTVVVPWLAQQFPKEIAFGPQGARVALWSGRSGRELDFRAKTLVNEYWGEWADRLVENADSNVKPWIERYWTLDREPKGAEALAEWPSNAQSAARTHDVWLLPRTLQADEHAIRARAVAAARPALILAEPAYLTATEAIGWPMRHKDPERFPREETLISEHWDALTAQYNGLPRTGLIAWGGQPYLSTGKLFRHGILADYGLRRGVWGLYARSGERRYREYGSRYNRHIADWWVAHWTAGDKVEGGFVSPGGYWEGHMPFVWGDRTRPLASDSSGHDIHNWLVDYYLTGDEYALHITRMVGEATKEHWWSDEQLRQETGQALERWHIPMILQRLACLYAMDWDEDYSRMARDLSPHLIDLDNPNGINDGFSGGALYKWKRNVFAMHEYYRTTGDESAREAVLKALDYNYRFDMIGPPFGSTNHAAFLYTIAYRWTGRRRYLRVAHQQLQRSLGASRLPGGVHTCAHTILGVPAVLGVLAEIEGPVESYPALAFQQEGQPTVISFVKPPNQSVEMSVYTRLAANADQDAEAVVDMADAEGRRVRDLRLREERAFRSSQPVSQGRERDRHLTLTVPADAPAGRYTLRFPNAATVRILDTTPSTLELEMEEP